MVRKLIALIVAIGLITAPLASAGAKAAGTGAGGLFSDMDGSWAREQVERWAEAGRIQGYADGKFRPDDSISRAEFIALVNRTYGYSASENASFRDVAAGSWYAEDIAKAAKAGYVSGYADGTFRPDQRISRQEAAKILYMLLKLDAAEGAEKAASFKDRGGIPSWSRPYVNAAASLGYMKGYPDGTFLPERPITRAEAVALLDRAGGRQLQEPGVYGQEEEQTVVAGNVTIGTKDVTLKNTVIRGDLILAPGIGEGEVTLDRVTVEGRTIVAGGGENSVIIADSALNVVIVDKASGAVRLAARGDTVILRTIVRTGAKLEEEDGAGEGFVDVEIATGSDSETVRLVGSFQRVTVVAVAKVDVQEGSVIGEIVVNAAVVVTGQGVVVTAIVNVEGASFDMQVEHVVLSDGVTFAIIAKIRVGSGNSGDSSAGGSDDSDSGSDDDSDSDDSDSGGSDSGGSDSGGSDSDEPAAPAELQPQAVFAAGDKLYVKYEGAGDMSRHSWTLTGTVTENVYQAVYEEAGDGYGVFALEEEALAGGVYTATLDGTDEIYHSLLLSSVTVSDDVYGYVYYGGDDSVGYSIDGRFVGSLDRQLAEQSEPLRDGDEMSLIYGDTIVFEAVWNEAGETWVFQRFGERLPLDAPGNVSAETVSNTALALRWDPVEHAEYYYVYYSDSPDGKFQPIRDESGNKLKIPLPEDEPFIDASNLPHTTRYYKVTAARPSAESEFSEIVFATTYYNEHIGLDFTVTDMAEHPTEPILYLTDKANHKLYAVNYKTKEIASVSFDFPAETVVYADGELYVALLTGERSYYLDEEEMEGAVAILDAATLDRKATVEIDLDPFDIAVDRSGYFYVTSGSSQWTEIKSYARSTLAETAASAIRQLSYIHMHPTLDRIYTVTTDTSPRDMTAFSVSNGTFVEPSYPGGYDSPYHGKYPMSKTMKLSPDGKYVFHGTGNVFRTVENPDEDMMYADTLGREFADIAFALADDTFYTAQDELIYAFDYGSFAETERFHTDGSAARLSNGPGPLAVVSELDGKQIIEIVEKDSAEATPRDAAE